MTSSTWKREVVPDEINRLAVQEVIRSLMLQTEELTQENDLLLRLALILAGLTVILLFYIFGMGWGP